MAERPTTSDGVESPRDRLPTLLEVLNRRTRAPVDLFSFYIYMRDQQRSVDYLDFWLDVSQHLSLCRHYVRTLRRSVLVETPDVEKALRGSRHSSQLLDSFDLIDEDQPRGRQGQSSSALQGGREEKLRIGDDEDRRIRDDENRRLSQFLRSSTDSSSSGSGSRYSVHGFNGTTNSNQKYNRNTAENHDTQRSRNTTHSHSHTHNHSNSNTHSTSTRYSQTSTPPPDPSNPSITRSDIRASAEKILYTYLLSGSEREIILPSPILHAITTAIEEHGRDDPEVFDAAKDYVFAAMSRDAFPGFLRARALGNLSQTGLLLRLILGLLGMFGGFWTAFTLLFLDRSRSERCWVILPFVIGVYALASHQYTLDPVLAIAGYSEYTFFHFVKVQEVFVRKMLVQRGGVVLGWWVLLSVALCCLFIFVPGTRL